MTPVAGTIARRLLSETTDMDSDGGTSTLGEAAHMGVWNMGASASAGGWWRAGSKEWAPALAATVSYPFGCLPATWPGGVAWCRAALGRGLAGV